eukprot:2100653-Rhodomonas_salina.1
MFTALAPATGYTVHALPGVRGPHPRAIPLPLFFTQHNIRANPLVHPPTPAHILHLRALAPVHKLARLALATKAKATPNSVRIRPAGPCTRQTLANMQIPC